MNFNQDIDRRIKKAIVDKEIYSFNNEEIENMINKAKVCKRKIIMKRMVCIIVFSLVVISSIVLIQKNKDKGTIIDKSEVNETTNNQIKTIEITDNASAAEVELSPSMLYEKVDYVILAKVKKINATNFDKIYKNGEIVYDYSFVRTIGNLEIIKCFKGNLSTYNELEFRCKGGKILLSELINSPDSQYVIDNLKKENIDENLFENSQNLYINVKYKDIPMIEEGKIYLLYLYKKAWGDIWIINNGYAIREYNYTNNSAYNNKSLIWESIDFIMEGGEK